MSGGSLQLRLYRIARRDGVPRADAVQLSGVGPVEAELIDKDDARYPPPALAYVMSPGMAKHAIGGLAGTPLGMAAVERLAGAK